MVNGLIEDALREKGITIEGYSDAGNKINDFDSSWDSSIEKLFTFIIMNNLNRYLFSFFLRRGSLDVDKIPFFEKLLDENKIKNTVKESFVKKYLCNDCDHLLFREVSNLSSSEEFGRKCPICGRNYSFKYGDLSDDFSINRSDLKKFLNELCSIGVIKKEINMSCPSCGEKEFHEDYECLRCGNKLQISELYSFSHPFLKDALKYRDGSWFEWFIYKICSHLYPDVEHNLIIEFEKEGVPKKAEIDVIAMDKNGKISVFECKDQIYKKPTLNEMGNLPDLSKLFEEVFFVSSYGIDKKAKGLISEWCERDINFIVGTDLESKFINEENILRVVETYLAGAIRLYGKLSPLKKEKVFLLAKERLFESDFVDENLSGFFDELLTPSPKEELFNEEEAKQIINFCSNNIINSRNVKNSIEIIRSLKRIFSLDFLLKQNNLQHYLSLSLPFLSEIPGEGFTERKPFFGFLTEIIGEEIDLTSLDRKFMGEFLLKFIPMFDVYYGHINRRTTLRLIDKLWEFSDEKCNQKFISVVRNIFDSQTDIYAKAEAVSNFFLKNWNTFSNVEKTEIKKILLEYSETDKHEAEDVKDVLLKLNN